MYGKEKRNTFLFRKLIVFDSGPIIQLGISLFSKGFQDLFLLELALPHCSHFMLIRESGLREDGTLRQRKILFFPLQGDKVAHLLKCSVIAGTNVIDT